MAARSVGSLEAAALRACSGTLDGSDKIDVALLRSRNEDKAAEEKNNTAQWRFCPFLNNSLNGKIHAKSILIKLIKLVKLALIQRKITLVDANLNFAREI